MRVAEVNTGAHSHIVLAPGRIARRPGRITPPNRRRSARGTASPGRKLVDRIVQLKATMGKDERKGHLAQPRHF
jgi:hypothetical protein